MAAWLLLGFGLAYVVFSLRSAARRREHSHLHSHADGTVHDHPHSHGREHVHAHGDAKRPVIAALVIVFLLGPCEALIPLLMYPAAIENLTGLVAVTLAFSIATVATMLTAIALGLRATRNRALKLPHGAAGVVTGGVLACCGAAMLIGF